MFADWPGVETASAGLDHDAEVPLTPELLAWADTVFVMDGAHRTRLSRRFRTHLDDKRVVCLDVPDRYAYMEPSLVALLRRRMEAHLPPA